jgi:hypothetical protein
LLSAPFSTSQLFLTKKVKRTRRRRRTVYKNNNKTHEPEPLV